MPLIESTTLNLDDLEDLVSELSYLLVVRVKDELDADTFAFDLGSGSKAPEHHYFSYSTEILRQLKPVVDEYKWTNNTLTTTERITTQTNYIIGYRACNYKGHTLELIVPLADGKFEYVVQKIIGFSQ